MIYTPGQNVLVDRALKATFVGYSGSESAIIKVGADTRVVSVLILSEEEA